MIASRTHGKRRAANFVTPSEYAIGVFLAEEAVPKSRQGRQTAAARSPRVPSRAVYQKELLASGRRGARRRAPPHKRTPSGSGCRASTSPVSLASGTSPCTTTPSSGRARARWSWQSGSTAPPGTTCTSTWWARAPTDLPRSRRPIASFIHLTFDDSPAPQGFVRGGARRRRRGGGAQHVRSQVQDDHDRVRRTFPPPRRRPSTRSWTTSNASG